MKTFKTFGSFLLSVLLAVVIVSLPYQSQALVMLPSVESIQQLKVDEATKQKLMNMVIQRDIEKLEREIRKLYRLPADARVTVDISTNQPALPMTLLSTAPAGASAKTLTWTVPASGGPSGGPTMVICPPCIFIFVTIIIVIAGYVIYHVIKFCKRVLGPKPPSTNEEAMVETSIGTALVNANAPGFDMNAAKAAATANMTVVGATTTLNSDTLSGVVAFQILTSTDLNTWKTEYLVTNTITMGGAVNTVVYDSAGNPITTANNGDCLLQDNAAETSKFWRLNLIR